MKINSSNESSHYVYDTPENSNPTHPLVSTFTFKKQ